MLHSVEKRKFHSHQKLFRDIDFIVNYLHKHIAFTKSLNEKYESKFPQFPHSVLVTFLLSIWLRCQFLAILTFRRFFGDM